MNVRATIGAAARRAAVVRAGSDPGATIELDLSTASTEDRQIIAQAATIAYDSRDYGRERGWLAVDAHAATDATPEAIAAAIRASQAEQAARDAAARAESEARQTAAYEHAAAAVAGPQDAWEDGDSRVYPHPDGYHCSHYDDYRAAYDAVPGVAECRAEARARDEQRRASRAAEDRAGRDAALAALPPEIRELVAPRLSGTSTATDVRRYAATPLAHAARADWIAKHGSERLRLAAAEGYECDAIYRDERDAIELPGWVRDTDDGWPTRIVGAEAEPRQPPMAALKALRDAREATPGVVITMVYGPCYRAATDEEREDGAADKDGDVRDGGVYLLCRLAWDGGLVYRLAHRCAGGP